MPISQLLLLYKALKKNVYLDHQCIIVRWEVVLQKGILYIANKYKPKKIIKKDSKDARRTQCPVLKPIKLVWDELNRAVKAKQPNKCNTFRNILQ